MESYVNAQVGEIVAFGKYPQAIGGKDNTPIQWRVLQNSGQALFLLSEYILDCLPYHNELTAITWRDCDLRKWLNDEFLNTAFTATEQRRVMASPCTNNGEASSDTEDKVFLLSVDEVQRFTDPGEGSDTKIRRRTIGTDYAKARKPNGCRLYVYDKGVEKDYIIDNGERRGCSWWWTRAQLQTEHPSRATFIGARSNIKRYGLVNLRGLGVRPALQLNLRPG